MSEANTIPTDKRFKNLTGRRFGRLIVESFAGFKTHRSGSRQARWRCVCDCGERKIITGDLLKYGSTSSCGCFRKEILSRRSKKHGMSETAEFRTWKAIKNRCYNKKLRQYPDYGGRGIIVCDRWLESFDNFIADMGPRPSSRHSIDRIDNNGNYEPDNCRWATRTAQNRNSRRNRVVEYNGRKMCLSELSDVTGVPYDKLRQRLDLGWTVEQAIFVPHGKRPTA